MRKLAASTFLTLTFGISSCNAAPPPKQTRIAEREVASAAPETQHALTIESLLRWSLEGRSGTDKILAELHRSFKMEKLGEAHYSGDGPIRLVDGHTLSFAYTLERSPHIQVGIKEEACVDPEWAAAVTGAQPDPVYQDAHGVDRGRTYYVTRNGTFLRFNTTPVTYRCVTAIRISPELKKRP